MITKDEKEQIFALYWGQEVLVRNINNTQFRKKIVCTQFNWSGWTSIALLKLKPLSSITDEDLKMIGFSFPYGREGIEINFTPDSYECHWSGGKYLPNEQAGYLKLKDFDYLRSRGYALPAFGFSVDELVQEGVFKLIDL